MNFYSIAAVEIIIEVSIRNLYSFVLFGTMLVYDDGERAKGAYFAPVVPALVAATTAVAAGAQLPHRLRAETMDGPFWSL